MESKVTLELKNQIYDLAGREIGRKIMDLLMQYGIDVIAEIGSISVNLPSIEISTISPFGDPYPHKAMEVARRHQFICKINGISSPMIQKVELDPFDYSDPEALKVRLTLLPISGKQAGRQIVLSEEKENA